MKRDGKEAINMKSINAIILLVLVSILCTIGCHKETEEQKIRKVIAEIQEAAEQKAIKTLLGHLSKAYRDPQGRDYNGIKGLLVFYFYRHQKVSVYIANLEVGVTDSTAEAAFEAVLTGGDKKGAAGGLLPDTLGMYHFTVSFIKESGDWNVLSAQWNRTGEGARE
ncbi:MAG TPA: hypothetical protein DCO77_05930 [Nitrospiraceae bacterium]|nr:hypothetical protein [Nitrospiraceae bacterium]